MRRPVQCFMLGDELLQNFAETLSLAPKEKVNRQLSPPRPREHPETRLYFHVPACTCFSFLYLSALASRMSGRRPTTRKSDKMAESSGTLPLPSICLGAPQMATPPNRQGHSIDLLHIQDSPIADDLEIEGFCDVSVRKYSE